MKSFNPLGAILNMSNEAVNRLRRMISQGSEVERKLSAGVFRSIISDMITLYEENRKYRGKGILVFNPSEPTASKYCTIQDLEADLSIAQEAMSSDMEDMFQKEDHLELMRLDPEHANEVIDSATNGLILWYG